MATEIQNAQSIITAASKEDSFSVYQEQWRALNPHYKTILEKWYREYLRTFIK